MNASNLANLSLTSGGANELESASKSGLDHLAGVNAALGFAKVKKGICIVLLSIERV